MHIFASAFYCFVFPQLRHMTEAHRVDAVVGFIE
jgi:hypothetical protein